MKWVRLVALSLILTSLVPMSGSAAEVRAECKTQGALALALAQVLEFEVASPEAAMLKLAGIGVKPIDGWQPAECLTDKTVIQIEESLRKAAAEKRVDAELALGAVARALTAIGAPGFIPALDRAMHFLPTHVETEPGLEVSPHRPK